MKHMLDYYEIKDISQNEIDKVLQALPKRYQKPSLFTRVKLQASITPKYYYIILLIITIFTISKLCSYMNVMNNYEETSNYYNAIIFYLIAVISLTIPEINRAHLYKMEEIERSCRYHYVHLLFQRITMFTLIILMTSGVLSIWSAYAYSISILALSTVVFTPILIILQLTLIIYKVANIKDTSSRIITFIVVSIICIMLFLPLIIANQIFVNLILIFIFSIILQLYLRKMFKEAKNNETFSIESE